MNVACRSQLIFFAAFLSTLGCKPPETEERVGLVGRKVSEVVKEDDWHKWAIVVRESNTDKARKEIETSKQLLAVSFYDKASPEGPPVVNLAVSSGAVQSLSLAKLMPDKAGPTTDQQFMLERRGIKVGTRVRDIMRDHQWVPQIRYEVGRSELRLDVIAQKAILKGEFSGTLRGTGELISEDDGTLTIACVDGRIRSASVSRPRW